MLDPNIKEINRLLRGHHINEAIELYTDKVYYTDLRQDGKASFKKYIDKNIMRLKHNIRELSAMAFIFVNDDEFSSEYALINRCIQDILMQKNENIMN